VYIEQTADWPIIQNNDVAVAENRDLQCLVVFAATTIERLCLKPPWNGPYEIMILRAMMKAAFAYYPTSFAKCRMKSMAKCRNCLLLFIFSFRLMLA